MRRGPGGAKQHLSRPFGDETTLPSKFCNLLSVLVLRAKKELKSDLCYNLALSQRTNAPDLGICMCPITWMKHLGVGCSTGLGVIAVPR